MFCTSVKVNLQ